MNIGDGLTLHSQNIGGKTTSGIYFLPNKPTKSHKSVPKTVKKLHANRNATKLNDEPSKAIALQKTTQNQIQQKTATTNKQIRKPIESESSSNDVIFIDNNTRIDVESKEAKINKDSNDKLKSKKKNESKEKKATSKPNTNNATSRNKIQTSKENKTSSNEIKVDTNFVTLTQDQLNTILSLVKTKQEIDVATVINKENKKSRENTAEKKQSSEGKRVEPTSVPGLDLDSDTTQKAGESKTDSDKENDASENVSKLLEKANEADRDNRSASQSRSTPLEKSGNDNDSAQTDTKPKKEFTVAELSGTLGGYGSRDREKSRLEQRRKKWIEDLNEQVERKKQLQNSFKRKSVNKDDLKSSSADLTPANTIPEKTANVKSAPNSATQQRKDESLRSNSSNNVDHIHESLPSAIRSSFFLGEAAPRDHAFSAKKRQEQQAWRDELAKQIKEKEKIKQEKTTKVPEDSEMWSRHFETMLPVQNKVQQSTNPQEVTAPPESPPRQVTQLVTSHQKQSPRNPAFNSDNVSGIYSGEYTTTSTGGARVQSNYLRSMTALLDPSQLDAIELKRQKQLEHRRVIAEQVEEKRRLKEAALRAKREEEELEEKRLEEERRKLKNQFEREKSKQHAIEEKRDRQTQELYQQVKEAEATALKEKFERRQQTLRSHGHDTSRLERTHKHELEKNMPSHRFSPPPTEHVPSLNIKEITSHHDVHESPRGENFYHSSGQQPLASSGVQAPTTLVARAVQTDDITVNKRRNRRNDTLLEILSDSDTETLYMDLPYPSARHNATKPRKTKQSDREQEARNRHYDRYSRTSKAVEEAAREKKGPKPKWGVGSKKKKYVPASNRYVASKREKEERENRLRKREEQLLAEQARNQPDRLLPSNSKSKIDDNTALRNAVENYRPQRRERSYSPEELHYRSRKPGRNRSSSPPVPALKNQMRSERSYNPALNTRTVPPHNRPVSSTTDLAKYKSSKHSPDSPVPDSDDFVEYRRSEVILDPNQPQTRPSAETEERNYSGNDYSSNIAQPQHTADRHKDPLLNADMLKQKERQDRILKEIAILRQGLLLKQREVASYPVAVAMPPGKNLPERTNDDNLT